MYILHYVPDTAALAVRLVLEELAQPYRAVLVDRATGEQNSAAYRRLQPLGLIPALETPDGPMFESAAILLWLADRHGALAPLPASRERAGFLSWFVFANNSVHTTLLQIFYPDRTAGEACATAALAAASRRMAQYLGLIEAMVQRDRPGWLSPTQPSILGYYLAMLLRWLKSVGPGHPGYIDSAAFPALHAVLLALESRPAALAVAQAESLGPTLFTNPQ